MSDAMTWVVWILIGITSLSHAYAIRNVVRTSIIVQRTARLISDRIGDADREGRAS